MGTEAAFVIRTLKGHEYRIFADGRTEGFSEPHVIINRIPLAIALAVYEAATDIRQNEIA